MPHSFPTRRFSDLQPHAALDQLPAAINGVGARRLALAQGRTLVQLAVIHRRATQLDPQGTGAGGHHGPGIGTVPSRALGRSEEHTSELQSLMRISYAVFCLKKKKKKTRRTR